MFLLVGQVLPRVSAVSIAVLLTGIPRHPLHNIFHHENSPSYTDAYAAQDIPFLTHDVLQRCTITVGWDFIARKLTFCLCVFACVRTS